LLFLPKKNDTPIKIDSKLFGVIGVVILIGCLYYYSDKIFVRKVIFNDDLIGDYHCSRCDKLVKWKKNSNLFTGVAQIYEPNAWYEIEYYRGIKHGFYRAYEGDKLIEEKNYKYGIEDGLHRVWFENGQLYEEVNFKNGEADGLYRIWYENGQLMYESTLKNGIEDGITKEWYENGQLKLEVNYADGKEKGISKNWYENGKLSKEATWKVGKLDGITKEWYENGQLNSERNYKNGKIVIVRTPIVKDATYYFNRALKKSKNKNHSGAIADYTKAIALNPNYAKAYYERGYTKFYLNDKNGACEDWEIATQMGYELARLAVSSKISICN